MATYFDEGISVVVAPVVDNRRDPPATLFCVYNPQDKLFLKTATIGISLRRNWTRRLTHAALFISPDRIAILLQQRGFDASIKSDL